MRLLCVFQRVVLVDLDLDAAGTGVEATTPSRELDAALKERRRQWEVTISRGGQSVTSVFPG